MDLEPIVKLTKDLKNAAVTLTDVEARYLVDLYYQMQDNRIRSEGQLRTALKDGEPHDVLKFFSCQGRQLEEQAKKALDAYAGSHLMGEWLYRIHGIGPVIAAGLLAHIRIENCDTAGKLWSFAGLDVGKLDKPWERGKKRPWNAKLKTLCWKISDSFVKVSGKEDALYGQLYAQKKQQLLKKNEELGFKDLAERYLATYKINKNTDAYKSYIEGKLPPAHIHAQAKRYAVKIFLSHLQQVWYEKATGKKPPKPFVEAILGHKDIIQPPN